MFALNAMQKACLPPKAFADILQRLEAQMRDNDSKVTQIRAGNAKGKKGANDQAANTTPQQESHDAVSEMLASHPDTLERIKPFLAAKQTCQ